MTIEFTLKKEKTPLCWLWAPRKKKPKFGVKKFKKTTIKVNVRVKKDKFKGICFHCEQNGHWKRSYKAYIDSLKSKKLGKASIFGMYMIEVNLSINQDS